MIFVTETLKILMAGCLRYKYAGNKAVSLWETEVFHVLVSTIASLPMKNLLKGTITVRFLRLRLENIFAGNAEPTTFAVHF